MDQILYVIKELLLISLSAQWYTLWPYIIFTNIYYGHFWIGNLKIIRSYDQCKETEANNRKGKTRDLFKKIRDTKGRFHGKMGSIKDRNGMDLTEAEDIKKRWQEYTEELYKKDLH